MLTIRTPEAITTLKTIDVIEIHEMTIKIHTRYLSPMGNPLISNKMMKHDDIKAVISKVMNNRYSFGSKKVDVLGC